ncbi:MAG: DUF6580 family putative transport protein [Candidatus Buchananbacteria bacterium]
MFNGMDKKTKLIAAVILVALGVVCRLLPHVGNFAPIAAIALFCGTYLGVRYALAVPAVAMIIGDFFIGFYSWPLMVAVYGSYLLIGLLGYSLKKNKTLETVFACSILASVSFFFFTNLAVWQFSPWYEKTLTGLIHCFVMALPFFRATILSDLFYVGVLFGAYEIVTLAVTSQKVAVKVSIKD